MAALASELIGKLTEAGNWVFEHIAIFHEQRGTGTKEALDNGLFDPVRYLQFERGLNISYQSVTEELAARAIRHERNAAEIKETLGFIDTLPARQAEALVWRYGNRKKGGQPLGSALVAKKMGVCKDTAQEHIDKGEAKMQEWFAQRKNRRLVA